MSSIKPFRAVHYNPEKIKDFCKVVCPPYDVISAEEQDQLHQLSPHNFIHILLGKDISGDDNTNNKYSRAQEIFRNWMKDGILIQDENPAIYFYRQEYKAEGQKYSRLGFISLMALQDEEASRIRPHENTHSHAVEDRLRLWSSLNSNLSCIFVCYSDQQKKIEKIFNKKVREQKPSVDIVDHDGVGHKLWRLDDLALIHEINESMTGQHLFIADGHHRYKVANELRRLKLGEMTGQPTGDEPFNYVMTYFTNIDSKDLQILPMHRIVRHFPSDISSLEECFRIDRIRSKEELLISLRRAGQNEHAFGLYIRSGVRLLRLKNKLLIDQHIQEGSRDYRHLDATILKHFVFDKLGITSEEIIYTKDFQEVTEMVDNGGADAGFVMNSVKISQLKAIALNGEKMPPKTTYFYPKVLSGLTVYKMD
jgi:uncharacterized protein (DUF1015 family)